MPTTDSIEAHSRAHYDRIAPGYDAMLETPANRAVRACFWRHLERALPTPSRVLDFGAGSGSDALHFAGLGHEVTAYDLSEGMIDVLRHRCAAAIAAGTVTALAGPLDAVRATLVARAPFDAVAANFGVFSTVERLAPVFRLLGELVRPGGWLIVSIQNPWYPADMRHAAFWRALLAVPFAGVIRYRSAELRHIHRYTPGQLQRAARPEFTPVAGPLADCGEACFGPRSAFRLVVLRRA